MTLVEFNQVQLETIKHLVDAAEEYNLENLKMCNDFHISVSKTFQIRNKTFEPLIQNLDKEFETTKKYVCLVLIKQK